MTFRILVAVVAGSIAGFGILFLMIPSLIGLLLIQPFYLVLGWNSSFLCGLGLGLVHGLAPALTAARIARDGKHARRRHRMMYSTIAGLVAGAAACGLLWSAYPPNGIQGPPILHVGNFVGIVVSALVAALATRLFHRTRAAPAVEIQ
jgi:MFS family permease